MQGRARNVQHRIVAMQHIQSMENMDTAVYIHGNMHCICTHICSCSLKLSKHDHNYLFSECVRNRHMLL